jgi:hypothetical protein
MSPVLGALAAAGRAPVSVRGAAAVVAAGCDPITSATAIPPAVSGRIRPKRR